MYFVYCIENLINGKKYIGKTDDLQERWSEHKYVAAGGKNKYKNRFQVIHSAIAKYGIENFKFYVVETVKTSKLAIEREKFWIAKWELNIIKYGKHYGYNLTDGGEGTVGYHHTEETKLKISKSKTGEKRSQATKEKISAIKKEQSKGSKNPRATINEEQVKEIKMMLKNIEEGLLKLTHQNIADKFGVTKQVIYKIAANLTWKHVK